MDSIKRVVNALNSNLNLNSNSYSLNCDTNCACNKCHPLEDIMK